MCKLLFLICFFLLSSAYAVTVRIGNSGIGVVKGESVYLLDLFEAGSHLKPYVGNGIDLSIVKQMSKRVRLQKLIGYDETILQRKLTDFNKLEAGLGDIILLALGQYIIQFTEDKLILLDNNSAEDGDKVQVAVRRDRNIFISYSHWSRMDAYNRVALLIHEALYSLVKPVCVSGICTQESEPVRRIIGDIFSVSHSEDLLDRLKRAVAYPEGHCDVNIIKFNFSMKSGAKLIASKEISYTKRNSNVLDDLNSFCSDYGEESRVLTVSALKYRTYLNKVIYNTDYGTQAYYRVISDLRRHEKFMTLSASGKCLGLFFEPIMNWMHMQKNYFFSTDICI